MLSPTVESAESASPYSVRGMASSGAMTAESRVSTISDTLRFNNDLRSPHYAPVVVEVGCCCGLFCYIINCFVLCVAHGFTYSSTACYT